MYDLFKLNSSPPNVHFTKVCVRRALKAFALRQRTTLFVNCENCKPKKLYGNDSRVKNLRITNKNKWLPPEMYTDNKMAPFRISNSYEYGCSIWNSSADFLLHLFWCKLARYWNATGQQFSYKWLFYPDKMSSLLLPNAFGSLGFS